MSAEQVAVTLTLSPEEALVLYALVNRLGQEGDSFFADQSEQRIVWDIEATLEQQLSAPLGTDYGHLLKQAQHVVRDATEG